MGLLHGPAELAPVSSSAHTTLVAWVRGWPLEEQGAARKRFELALHAGAAAALLLAPREPARVSRRVVALACVPPALAGVALRRPIERRLGTPRTIAAALAGGAVAMVLAERRPGPRRREQATAGDALALGAAQALALVPGVSRSGASRTAARLRGFSPVEARALSDAVGLPITVAAVASSARASATGGDRATAALGAGAAFVSTLASGALLRRSGGSLYPYAAYRLALAAAVVRRLRENARR